MKNKAKNISVISTGSWVPSNLNDQEKNKNTYNLNRKSNFRCFHGIHDFEKKKQKSQFL